MATRFAQRFETADGTRSFTWPTNHLEHETEQPLATSYAALTGSNYSFDQIGSDATVKDDASERVRFLLVGLPSEQEIMIDRVKEMRSFGRGKLWSKGEGGIMRWAWARMDPMPPFKISWDQISAIPVSISFTRNSDWFEESLTVLADTAIAADPQVVAFNSPGNTDVYDAVVILKGPFTNPNITNPRNGMQMGSTTDAAVATTWLRFDAGRMTVGKSTDSGATWADDTANRVLPSTQHRMMVLKSGLNNLSVAGANGGSIYAEWYGAWE